MEEILKAKEKLNVKPKPVELEPPKPKDNDPSTILAQSIFRRRQHLKDSKRSDIEEEENLSSWLPK